MTDGDWGLLSILGAIVGAVVGWGVFYNIKMFFMKRAIKKDFSRMDSLKEDASVRDTFALFINEYIKRGGKIEAIDDTRAVLLHYGYKPDEIEILIFIALQEGMFKDSSELLLHILKGKRK